MTSTQNALQAICAEYLAAALEAFLTRHPDTEFDTVRRAIRDTETDADVIFSKAKGEA